MKATHRVKNGRDTLGFVIDGQYMAYEKVKYSIDCIDNLTLQKNGVIRAEKNLPNIGYNEAYIKRKYNEIIKSNRLKRDIQRSLCAWRKSKVRRVLSISGPKGCGKTTEVLKFAYKYYEYVIHVDMNKDMYSFVDVVRFSDLKLGMESYCEKAYLPKYKDNRNTILIVDEVQNSKEVYNAIQNMHDKLKCDIVIIIGNLFMIKTDSGYNVFNEIVRHLELSTLSFKEFARAFGSENLLKGMALDGRVHLYDYRALWMLYDSYRSVGGYPRAVMEFMRTGKVKSSRSAIKGTLKHIEQDVNKLVECNSKDGALMQVFRELFYGMKHNKKNIYEAVHSYKESTLKDSDIDLVIDYLRSNGIIDFCHLAVDGDINNIRYCERLYFCDCGMASYLSVRLGFNSGIFQGMITETFAFNELKRLYGGYSYSGETIDTEVCFSIYNEYEIDFIVRSRHGRIYGIEVKTNTGKPKSLREFVERGLVDKGILAKPSLGGHGKLWDTIPIYMVGCRFPYEDKCDD